MSILGNDINKCYIPFNGDYHPVSIYEGEKVIFEPKKIETEIADSNNLSVVNTYNDFIDNLEVHGNTHQDTGRTIGVKKDTVVQFDDFQGEYGVVEVKANENLLDGTSDEWFEYISVNAPSGRQLKQGDTITLSVKIKWDISTEPLKSVCIIDLYDGINTNPDNRLVTQFYVEVQEEVGEETYSLTGVVTHDSDRPLLSINKNPTYAYVDGVMISNLKLELGDKATPWIPSKADQEAGVEMPSYELTRCGRNLFDVDNFLSDKYEYGGAYGNALPYPLGKTFVASTNFVRDDGMGCWFYNSNSTSGFWLNHEKVAISVDRYVLPGQNFQIGVPRNIDGFFDNYYIQIELGTTAHSYEPYQGDTYTIQPNTPTKIPLLEGTNTFFADSDVNLEVQYLKSDNATEEDTDLQTPTPNFPEEIESVGGEIMVSGKNLWKDGTTKIHCVAGKKYYLKFDLLTAGRVIIDFNKEKCVSSITDFYENSDKRWIIASNVSHEYTSFTILKDCDAIITSIYPSDNFKNIMFSTCDIIDTPYEPYAGEPQTITIPKLNKIGDMQDILHVDRASQRMWIERKCKEIVLDGSEDWVYWVNHPDYKMYNSFYSYSVKNGKITGEGFTNRFKIIKQSGYPQGDKTIGNFGGFGSNYLGVRLMNSVTKIMETDTKEVKLLKLKQWLSENPTTVIYQLETSEIEELEYNEDLLTFYPTTVINTGVLPTTIKATMKQFR